MTVSNVLNSANQAINYARQNSPTLATPNQMMRNAQRVAIPAIALVGITMMHEAEAITMTECFENCDRHRDAHALGKLICYTLCAIFSKG